MTTDRTIRDLEDRANAARAQSIISSETAREWNRKHGELLGRMTKLVDSVRAARARGPLPAEIEACLKELGI